MSVKASARAHARSRVPAKDMPDFHKAIGKDIHRVALRVLILYKLAHCRTNSYSLVKDIQEMQSHGPKGVKGPKAIDKASGHAMWMGRNPTPSPSVIKSEVYNMISALERSGYIMAKKRKSGGRPMKYYQITPQGVKALKETQEVLTRTVKDISRIIEG